MAHGGHSHGQSQPIVAVDPKTIPKDLKIIADFLLGSSSQLSNRKGTLNGSKVDFFKGKHAANALMRDAYQKSANSKTVAVNSRDDADHFLQKLLQIGVLLKVQKDHGSPVLKPNADKIFSSFDYYIWLYQGSQLWSQLMGVGILIIIFAGALFPLWPPFMRQGVYYLSLLAIAFLGFLMFLGVLRMIIYVILILVLGQGGWLFPNLFADVGFFESFQPVWVWEAKKSKKSKSKKE